MNNELRLVGDDSQVKPDNVELADEFGYVGKMRRSQAAPESESPTSTDGPQLNGVPVHGPDRLLRRGELDKLELKSTGYVKVLNLTNEADLEVYQRVIALVALGNALIVKELTEYDAEMRGWRMLLVWREFFFDTTVPSAALQQPTAKTGTERR